MNKFFIKSLNTYKIPRTIVIYTFFLTFLADCVIFVGSKENISLDIEYLCIYVLFSAFVLLFSVQKGLAMEQLDLLISGRWAALDFLPGNNVDRIVFSSCAQTIRCRQYQVFLALIFVSGLYLNSREPIWPVIIVPFFLVMGHICLVLLQSICLWLSPKKYLALSNSIFTNFMMFFSGTSYPTVDFLEIENLKYFLPTNALIYIPSKILFHTLSGVSPPNAKEVATYFVATVAWTTFLYAAARMLNYYLRIKNHA